MGSWERCGGYCLDQARAAVKQDPGVLHVLHVMCVCLMAGNLIV